MMKALVVGLVVLGTVLALTVMAWLSRPLQSPQPAPALAPSGIVDVGGHNLFFRCSGQGGPTVVLEAGSGDDSTVWAQVIRGVAGTTRVFAYDRANLGRSDKGIETPRTVEDMARDLHALLEGSHVAGPYILVGHSMGGLIVRVFASLYSKDVVGMVLVDAAHPDMGPRLLAGLPPESADESESIRAWRGYFTYLSNSNGCEQSDPEGVDLPASYEQIEAARPLGDLPLVVISRSPNNPNLTPFPMPALPADTLTRLRRIWLDLQHELAGLSSTGTLVIATQAGHYIQTEEPELVMDAILKSVVQIRSDGSAVPSARETGTVETALSAPSAAQTAGADHAPVILRVAERQERLDGRLIVDKDIYFTDAGGDAVTGLITLVSTSPRNVKGISIENDFIVASSDEQKREALVTSTWTCGGGIPNLSLVLEYRIQDQAGNLSAPVTFTVSCP
jgi:pimeloyl-ACP methyl ester carboxylesterase